MDVFQELVAKLLCKLTSFSTPNKDLDVTSRILNNLFGHLFFRRINMNELNCPGDTRYIWIRWSQIRRQVASFSHISQCFCSFNVPRFALFGEVRCS